MVLPLHVGHTPCTPLPSLSVRVLDGAGVVVVVVVAAAVDVLAATAALPGSTDALLGGCAGGLLTLLFLLYPDDCAVVAAVRVSLATGAGSLKPPVGGSAGVQTLPLPKGVVPGAVIANADVDDAPVVGDCDESGGGGGEAAVCRRTNVAGSSILD